MKDKFRAFLLEKIQSLRFITVTNINPNAENAKSAFSRKTERH